MQAAILIVHLLLALGLIGLVLLQRSEGGGLGAAQSQNSLFSPRGQVNFLTRTTAVLAACFLGTSLFLAFLADRGPATDSILDQLPFLEGEGPPGLPQGGTPDAAPTLPSTLPPTLPPVETPQNPAPPAAGPLGSDAPQSGPETGPQVPLLP